ncbi:prohibitin family protein [Nisaea nitritireducens]|uniref:prohibitin family protein n=1 Tax=Nisaea nitritireducens TaxID=568392 RepID=UPI001867D8BE|nr:prohibitin family protein [Nisaea nitritireducens]
MKALKNFMMRSLPGVTIAFMIAAFIMIYFTPNMVITIPAGYIGVLWKRFDNGTITNRFYREGNRLILPWNKIISYDARMQRVSEDYDIISANGLAIGANITFRFRISRKRIGLLHKYLGPNYLNTVLIPKIGAIARAEAAKYSPVQLYSTNREDVEEAILAVAKEQLVQVTQDVIATEAKERATRKLPPLPDAPDPVVNLHDVSVRSVTLPHLVERAIERKEEQFHINQEYNFRLDRERKESERKAIEARGIQSFQRIVSDGITDAYLRWKGIDATLQLALSNNSKIVLIGSGKDGLPIILGPLDNNPGNAGAPAPGTHPGTELEALLGRQSDTPTAKSPQRANTGDGIFPNSSTADLDPGRNKTSGTSAGAPSVTTARPPAGTNASQKTAERNSPLN